MVPEPHQYLSFLMGADAIADRELADLGIEILVGAGTPFRGLLVPEQGLAAYRDIVRDRIAPGYWNDIVGRHEIFFLFKLEDGSVRELTLSEATGPEIARLCSALNDDPIEKTSDVRRYLATNAFYREAITTLDDRDEAPLP